MERKHEPIANFSASPLAKEAVYLGPRAPMHLQPLALLFFMFPMHCRGGYSKTGGVNAQKGLNM